MIIPINCPLCGDVLLNDYKLRYSSYKLRKTCEKRLDHKFACVINQNEEIIIVRVDNNFGNFFWNFEKKHMFFTPPKNIREGTNLPWFEPVIKDKKSFFNKLKTYILLS